MLKQFAHYVHSTTWIFTIPPWSCPHTNDFVQLLSSGQFLSSAGAVCLTGFPLFYWQNKIPELFQHFPESSKCFSGLSWKSPMFKYKDKEQLLAVSYMYSEIQCMECQIFSNLSHHCTSTSRWHIATHCLFWTSKKSKFMNSAVFHFARPNLFSGTIQGLENQGNKIQNFPSLTWCGSPDKRNHLLSVLLSSEVVSFGLWR